MPTSQHKPDETQVTSVLEESNSVQPTGAQVKSVNPLRDDWVLVDSDGAEYETNNSDFDEYLRAEGLTSVQPADVDQLLADGYTIVDVRLQWTFDEWHLNGNQSRHVPIFREIKGNSPAQIARKMGFALFVEFPPTERNFPQWLEAMESSFSKDSKLIVACDIGGILAVQSSRRIMSESLEAAFYLKQLGYSNVVHLQGGFCALRSDPELLKTTDCTLNLPWWKTVAGLREFFPKPCGYSYVQRCAKCTLDLKE
eukprot:CAMPEP_0197858740 /NCGR_PEP_ID=MMETSP1438-20131217/32765_1 /TAXON_ID=1461541 /ORGANISM="Pterosperma sp., Strain CCMP1384" /LENGTH=253 /DNA_ID=CAMNT_0043474995 /DNA_START=347 /DNA_END=1109 /DNA_ORIENTATION=+